MVRKKRNDKGKARKAGTATTAQTNTHAPSTATTTTTASTNGSIVSTSTAPTVTDMFDFDQRALDLAGGNVELLQSVKTMISSMDDKELWQCIEDIKSGKLGPDALMELVSQAGEGEEAEAEEEEEERPTGFAVAPKPATGAQSTSRPVTDEELGSLKYAAKNSHNEYMQLLQTSGRPVRSKAGPMGMNAMSFPSMNKFVEQMGMAKAHMQYSNESRILPNMTGAIEGTHRFSDELDGIPQVEREEAVLARARARDADDEDEEDVAEEEFSIDLDLSSTFFDPYKFHDAVFKSLQVTTYSKPNQRMHTLFSLFSTLCDPYTQPSNTGEYNEMILSADLVSDLVIALMYPAYVDTAPEETDGIPELNVPAFDMAYDIAQIIEKIMILLNADDEDVLMSIKNDEDTWEKELHKWLPHSSFSNIVNIASDFHHMILLYTIATAGVLVIHKLYQESGNICLNPFLSLFLQLWKNQTRVIFLGIEIDRRDEEMGFPGYPEVIRFMIKGASALRSMIALILNDDFERRLHDLKHESLINFMRPWGRKFSNGSITRDIRIFIAALLALGSELDSVTELLFNFDPEDRYDEDIKYMFEMELEYMDSATAKGEGGDTSGEEEEVKPSNEETEEEDGMTVDPYHKHHREGVKYLGNNRYLEIEKHEEIETDDDERDDIDVQDEAVNGSGDSSGPVYDLHPDCHCDFEDFESEYDGEEEEEEEEDKGDIQNSVEQTDLINQLNNLDLKQLDMETIKDLHLELVRNINNGPSAVRNMGAGAGAGGAMNGKKRNMEVDSKGRDWRDIPRGDNIILNRKFVDLLVRSTKDSTVFITPIEKLLDAMKEMTEQTVETSRCEQIIQSVAWVVQYERETMTMSKEEMLEQESDPNINTDVIYNFLKTDDNFVKMMNHNPSSSFFVIDELLMAQGYRRVLIWFLTHLPLNQWLINYFHDLLVGNRGSPPSEKGEAELRFPFSREGALELSEIEKSMLLHEFLSNAVIFLSRGSSYELEDVAWRNESAETKVRMKKELECEAEDDKISTFITNRSNAQKLIKVICLMLKSLEKHGILQPGDPEYRVEIQTLLVQWVGVGFVPEARELFFRYSDTTQKIACVNKASNDNNSSNTLHTRANAEKSLMKTLQDSKLRHLIAELKNFEPVDVFMIMLNIAKHYQLDKDICLNFMRDLNKLSKTYKDDVELIRECDVVFVPLNEAIHSGADETVVEIAHASGILSSSVNVLYARRLVSIFTDVQDEDPEEKIAAFREGFHQLMCSWTQDHAEREGLNDANAETGSKDAVHVDDEPEKGTVTKKKGRKKKSAA
jgi:hypothetical protein